MATIGGEAGAHRLDVALGERIRGIRKGRGLSQERLAEAVGVTFQQVQKYERGANRVSFSRLALIAEALETPLSELISGLGLDLVAGEADADTAAGVSPPGASELVRAYAAIRTPAVRRCIVELVQELARGAAGTTGPSKPRDDARQEPAT